MHTVKGLEAADAVQSPARWKVPEFRAHVLEDARRTLEGLVSEVRAGVDTRVQVSAGSTARTILEHAADVRRRISSSWDGAEASSCLDRRPCASFVRTTGRCW